jgi:hypothetical protein
LGVSHETQMVNFMEHIDYYLTHFEYCEDEKYVIDLENIKNELIKIMNHG